jgi:uncharacterized protein
LHSNLASSNAKIGFAMKNFLLTGILSLCLVYGQASADYDSAVVTFLKGDHASARKEIESLANQGHADSQFFLGSMYETGMGVRKSKKIAIEWYTKAANQGHPDAIRFLGFNDDALLNEIRENRLQKMRMAYIAAAESGDPKGQHDLAIQYWAGLIVPKNLALAIVLFRQSAEQGYDFVQHNLGQMYYGGEGVAKDLQSAAHWYTKSADQGFMASQVKLGNMYAIGDGVVKDDQMAVSWFRRAAEKGDADAQYNLAVRYEKGTSLPKDPDLTIAWYRKSAAQGYAKALSRLGLIYLNGDGIKESRVKAYALISMAINRGVSDKDVREAIDRIVLTEMEKKQVQTLITDMRSKPGNIPNALDKVTED